MEFEARYLASGSAESSVEYCGPLLMGSDPTSALEVSSVEASGDIKWSEFSSGDPCCGVG